MTASAITNTTTIPRPILRLAALLLAISAIIIIAGSVRDMLRSVGTPPAITSKPQPAPAIASDSFVYCMDAGRPIYVETDCFVPVATPGAP